MCCLIVALICRQGERTNERYHILRNCSVTTVVYDISNGVCNYVCIMTS